ncbi:PREDICTED: kelch-like protein 17 [Branchiostoma belcheri]|uniref:Kelch-like protein 17 n=1 Tax=Branchiostoma belcheri TaxID=7741 RepID=A0A6P5AM42_BRABE|nr:PREDICTED: kelch-like protein 17 [Branchiostoma belcheri]
MERSEPIPYDEQGRGHFENTNHVHDLNAVLNDQRQNGEFLDVVINVQDKRFPCHRAVLASTPYFKAMLSSDFAEQRMSEVTLHDIDSSSFSKILDFLYTGKISVGIDDVQDILKAADMLRIDNIFLCCEAIIEEKCWPSNCIGVMRIADMYGFSDIGKVARRETLTYFSEMAENEEFLTLTEEELLDLLKDKDLCVTNEEEVVDSVIRWLDHDHESRRTAIVAIFREIRLMSMRVSALMKLESHPVILDYPECLAKITAAKEMHLATTSQASASAEVDEAEVRPIRLGKSDDLAILVSGWKADDIYRDEYPTLTTPFQSVICLDPDDSWANQEGCHHVTNLPTTVSSYMSVTSAERRLYLTGGRAHPLGVHSLVGQQGPQSAPSTQAFRYDFPTDTWTILPDMPRARAGHQSVVVGGKLFLVGGDTDDTPAFSMDCYDLQEEAWIKPPGVQMPDIAPSSEFTVTACGSKLVIAHEFSKLSHDSYERRDLRVHGFDVKTFDWLCSDIWIRCPCEGVCKLMTSVEDENVHILLHHYPQSSSSNMKNQCEMFVYDVEKGTLSDSRLEEEGDLTGNFCRIQYMYENDAFQFRNSRECQEDLSAAIVYYGYIKDNEFEGIYNRSFRLPGFALSGHSLVATKKSSIGWYCRDLHRLERRRRSWEINNENND